MGCAALWQQNLWTMASRRQSQDSLPWIFAGAAGKVARLFRLIIFNRDTNRVVSRALDLDGVRDLAARR